MSMHLVTPYRGLGKDDRTNEKASFGALALETLCNAPDDPKVAELAQLDEFTLMSALAAKGYDVACRAPTVKMLDRRRKRLAKNYPEIYGSKDDKPRGAWRS